MERKLAWSSMEIRRFSAALSWPGELSGVNKHATTSTFCISRKFILIRF
jgi:hypothetical protein